MKRAANWLLLAPFIGTLWVPSYNSLTPMVLGVPFFYWYQFAWVALSALITALVYFVTKERAS